MRNSDNILHQMLIICLNEKKEVKKEDETKVREDS